MRVFKFGGASVKDAEGVKNVVKVLTETGHENTVVVVSAMGKITNAFEGVVEAYFTQSESSKSALQDVEVFHQHIIDELFEALTLIQTKKITKFPIVLFGSDFWSGMIDWIKKTLLDEYENISPEDLDLIKVVDDVDEAVAHVVQFHTKNTFTPNF